MAKRFGEQPEFISFLIEKVPKDWNSSDIIRIAGYILYSEGERGRRRYSSGGYNNTRSASKEEQEAERHQQNCFR